MKRIVPPALLALAAALFLGSPAHAQEFIQLSVAWPIQLYPETAAIEGLRLNLIYGRNTSVAGIDLGLINHTTEEGIGFQWGLVGLSDGSFTGWQKNWGANLVKERLRGLQTGVFNAAGGGEGIQVGIVNYTERLSGLQVSLINYAESFYGVQIGLVNIIRDKETLPVLPIVNWSFRETVEH